MCVSYVKGKELYHSNKLYNNYAHVLYYYVNPVSCNIHTPFDCKWVLIVHHYK